MEVNYTKMEGLEPKSNGTIVYQGTLDFVAEGDGGSLTITLATPYLYGGGNLLVGIDNTTKLGWKDIYFYGQEVTEAGWGGASSTSLESVIGILRNFIPKTTFTYEPGEAPECAKPRNLSINYTGGSEATVSWTGNATAWNIDVNGTVTAITENSYTLTNLELATTYEVKVQANCGNALSDWVTASFTTDLCLPADECAITIVLTDAYDDGWSGNKLEVVDDATEVVLGSYTLTDGGTGTFVLNVCNGRKINFVYRALGYYQHENGYVITDINGEVICEHEGCKNAVLCTAPTDGLITSYIVDCTIITCKTPTNLAASEISAHSAKLTWTEKGEATAWKLAYKESTATEFTEVDATAIPFVLNGLDAETKYIVKVRPVCDEADDKWSKELSFTTAVACPAPSNMAVVPAPTYAEISWTGSSESYEIEWSEPASYTPSSEATWFLYDDDFYTESVGMSTAATWQFGVMYPATDLTGIAYLYKVAFYEAVQYESGAPLTISIKSVNKVASILGLIPY